MGIKLKVLNIINFCFLLNDIGLLKISHVAHITPYAHITLPYIICEEIFVQLNLNELILQRFAILLQFSMKV